MGLWGDAKAFAGEFVDANAHMAGSLLSDVGLDDWGHKVDKWGDGIADDLGAGVGELNLGESDDPKELVHGDVKALGDTVKHLQNFASAFTEAYEGLSRTDSEHWQGKAAEAFRKKFGEHPIAWQITAEACTDAAKALDALSHAIESAQGQAKTAIDTYNHAQQVSKDAHDQYKHEVDSYNHAVNDYNNAVKAGQSPTQPIKPGDFHDPGDEGRKQAAQTLMQARKSRHEAAQTAEAAIKAATAKAPKKAGFWDQLGMDMADAPQLALTSYEHFNVGAVKAVADVAKFARGLNPYDPYNLSHPAQYWDHVNQTAAGLVQARDHPMQLLSAVVGSGWSHDPSEAGGKLLANLASGALTGGGSEAGAVGARIGIDAAENAARNEAVHLGEDAAANMAKKAADGVAEHPPMKPVSTNPAGLPDSWLKPPAEGGANPFAHSPAPEPMPVHEPAPQLDHAPVHEPAPEPVHQPVHEPAPEPVQQPTHEPVHDPAHQPAPEPAPAPEQPWKSLPRQEKMRIAQDEVSEGAQTFANKSDAVAYGHKHWDGYAENLPKNEREALTDYTKGATDDSAYTYKDINGFLRTGKGGNAQIDSQIQAMDKALAGCKVPEDVVVCRSLDLGYLKVHPSEMPGEIFTEEGYMSTSLGNEPLAGGNAVLHLKVPAGTDGMFLGKGMSRFGDDEAELLLGRGQKWKVSRVIKGPDGTLQVYGEVV